MAGMDIKIKKLSICHALRKRRLATTDIFLFDVGKAKTFDTVNYEVLEKLKNGRILASKCRIETAHTKYSCGIFK